jgi:hypothetical protein
LVVRAVERFGDDALAVDQQEVRRTHLPFPTTTATS